MEGEGFWVDGVAGGEPGFGINAVISSLALFGVRVEVEDSSVDDCD